MAREGRYRLGVLLAALLCALLWAFSGLAEAQVEVINGYFTERKYVRISPEPNASVVAWVPPDTPLDMRPVSDRYAEVTYNGVTGYIHYVDVVTTGDVSADAGENDDMPGDEEEDAQDKVTVYREEQIVAFVAYSTSPQTVLKAPRESAEAVKVCPAYTPLSVVARSGGYMRVAMDDGGYGYVADAGLLELRADMPVIEYEAYIDQPRILYEQPLLGADVVAVLPPPSRVSVTARNGDFARVEAEGQVGYVLEEELIAASPVGGEVSYGVVPVAAILYSAPDAQSFTEEYVPANTIVETDAANNGYSRISGSGLYIRTDALTPVQVEATTPRYGFWNVDQALCLNTTGTLVPTGVVMRANTLVEVQKTQGEYYLLSHEGSFGFVPKTGFETISVSTPIRPIAAYVTRDVALLSQPFSFSSPIGQSLAANTHLWLKEESGEYYRVEAEGKTGYISKAAIELLGEDVAVNSFEVYVDRSIPLLHFPSRAYGRQIAMLPENSLVKVLAKNGDFYYVQNILGVGYLPKDDIITFEQAERQAAAGDARYYLFLNKATRELTVYHADVYGNRTDRVQRTATVAIGKQTTPTPSGIFTLGGKERWHHFNPSYAPFVIQYTSGRYLHGPLYYSMTETSLNEARIEDFGTMATGGCLRMPYADALWIYFHCLEGTTLEIVNGV